MKNTKTLLSVVLYFLFTVPSMYLLVNLYSPSVIFIIYGLVSIAFICILVHVNSRSVQSYYINECTMLYDILEDVDAMIIVWTSDYDVVNVNDCFTRKTGYTATEFKKLQLLQATVPVTDENGELLPQSEICSDKQTTIPSKSGSELTAFWKTNLIKDSANEKTYMSIGIDLTEMTSIKSKLCASESRFEISMELSEIGLLYKQLNSDEYYMSKNLESILGFKSQTVKVDEFREMIHPNDKSVFDTYLNSSVERANVVTSIELRIKCADGGYHWFNYRYKLSDYFGDNSIAIGGSLIDISKDKQKDILIEKMAYIDEITQIFNRNRFMMMGQETYQCSKELDLSYWLMIFDVDKFHIINDTCGYQNGNVLLKEIALVILKELSEGGFCARIGGDNFAIILRDNGDDSGPMKIIQRIQASLSSLSVDVFSNQTITASAGYCKLPTDGADFSEILEHAEFALRLGENPRSNIVRYDNTVHDKIIAKSALEKEIHNALQSKQLHLFYQPKINLSDNTIMGAEALIRWIKPDGTIINPNSFIPIAENSNLITKISEFVVNEACRQNKIWQDMGLPPINISVNLSSTDFYQTDVCKTIQDAIDISGLNPKWLEIELTETLALKDVDQAIKQMTELNDIGVRISMDDFGTGYSSLSYIQVLPINVLKLDRSFIMYLEDDEISRQIVSSVINICKSKKIGIVAEGIETLGQAQILKNAGCDLAQGYYFGRPMASGAFEDYLRKAQ